MTQPADSANLSERDVMLRFNLCRIFMALTGAGTLLAYEAMTGALLSGE